MQSDAHPSTCARAALPSFAWEEGKTVADTVKLKQKTVNERVDSHPLSSAPVRNACEVIERHGKETVGRGIG